MLECRPMPAPDIDELRATLRLHVLTDQLFEIDRVPLTPAAVQRLRTATPAPPPASPPDTADRAHRLEVLDREQVKGCTRCALSTTRTNTVFGQGHPAARVVFVGEAPGY